MVELLSRLLGVGVIAVGGAIAVSSFGIVRAERAAPNDRGTFRCDTGVACVTGNSTSHQTLGVLGISSGEGIEGVTFSATGKAGVRGASRGTTGTGYGVVGTSSNGVAIWAHARVSRSAAIRAQSEKGDGIFAESSGKDEVVLRAEAGDPHTAIFIGTNQSNFAHCVIDAHANLTCTGNINSNAIVESTHRDSFGHHVVAYAAQSATATIDDVGTGRMVAGVAAVRIDPAFAALMDRRSYYVFVTPLGETRGLYVSRKTASGFEVREIERGRANLDFDYRIVAHPIDAPSDRLPTASTDDRLTCQN